VRVDVIQEEVAPPVVAAHHLTPRASVLNHSEKVSTHSMVRF
jgi:hypothetical protein